MQARDLTSERNRMTLSTRAPLQRPLSRLSKQTLLRLYRSEMPEEGYRIDCLLPSFYSCLQQEERVDRLYRIDLGESIREIPSSMIKSWVKPLVGDGSVYRLISFLASLFLKIWEVFASIQAVAAQAYHLRVISLGFYSI